VIVVFNALAWGFEHVPFDAALIASLAQAFPSAPVHFHAEADHLTQTRQYLERRAAGDGRAEVVWKEASVSPRDASTRARLGHDLMLTQRVLAEAQRLGADRVISCCMHPTTGLSAFKALSHLYRRAEVAFIHHASMLRLVSSRRYHPFLTLANGRLRQVVLGDSIRQEVVRRLPALATSLYAIRHPYFFDDTAVSELPAAGPLGFSFLGVVDPSKGFAEFVTLAEAVSRAANGGARFDLIGGARDKALADIPPSVKTYGQGGPMPRDTYERLLRETSYAVLPYDPDHYSLIASGAILDALAAGKPLIALRNSQFDEMFRVMGDIGYLCDGVAEMREVVDGLVRDPPRDRYRRQSQNILDHRGIYGPAAVGAQLREVLKA
jgi:glycosyltransferase involved in cell wall biosynthesis